MSDILSPIDEPPVIHSLFDQNKAVGHDGHTQPLLSVQVTELQDGVFVGYSSNHVVVDGASFFHFLNTWSKIHRAANQEEQIRMSHPHPIYHRWVPEGYSFPIWLPFTHPDEFVTRYETPKLRERIFHFSSNSAAMLKAKANEESSTHEISSLQVVTALIWRSIVCANRLSHDQVTNCKLPINNRHRLDPPLPQAYFGSSINIIKASTTVGELLQHNLGWAALLVHQSVANHTDKNVHDFLEEWTQSPFVYHHRTSFDPNSVIIASSPRFDAYGNEFGLGKAAAFLCGPANKFVGKVMVFPGHEGR